MPTAFHKRPRKHQIAKKTNERSQRSSQDGGNSNWEQGERIAKYLARTGVASRRECEALIEAGKVTVNGRKLTSPAFKVSGNETIKVENRKISIPAPTRLWKYHKPTGLITTNNDPKGRSTIYDSLPKSLPRVVSVGRLDMNTEGLLLLTNDGELARALELPKNAFERTYRVRAHGIPNDKKLEILAQGVTLKGVNYAPIQVELERQTNTNCWLNVSLKEGKYREVRQAFNAVGLTVNRLIRTHYGPFELSKLSKGAIEEIDQDVIVDTLGHLVPSLKTPIQYPKFDKKPSRGFGKSNKFGKINSESQNKPKFGTRRKRKSKFND